MNRLLVLVLFLSAVLCSAEEVSSTFTDAQAQSVVAAMEREHVPGAILVVVKDGQVLVSRGFGYANLETKLPVDPGKTLFRIASVSKLFTTTALLQLVEQGKVDLNADVNTILKDLSIPPTFPEPIRVEDLMMHTGGFDKRYLNISTWDADKQQTLPEYLVAGMPERVFPPKTLTSYSNYSVGLAGYVIETVSGKPYLTYMRESVLEPLGMRNSTFSLPPDRFESLSKAYVWKDDAYALQPHDYMHNVPAGGLFATANDMARFMLMQLGDGALDGNQLLKPETLASMQSRHFANDPRIAGMCYGFFEETMLGHRVLVHDGYWNRFTSKLVLLPEQKIGLFMSCNADGGGAVYSATIQDILKTLVTPVAPPSIPAPSNGAVDRAKQLAGVYRPTRFSRYTATKLESLIKQTTVIANDDGSLTWPQEDADKKWLEVEPLLYRPENGDGLRAFRLDGDRGAYYFNGIEASERVHPLEEASVQAVLVAVFFVLFLAGALSTPARFFGQPVLVKATRLACGMMCGVNLVFLIGIAYTLTAMDRLAFVHEPPQILQTLLGLPLVNVPITLAVLVLAALARSRQQVGVRFLISHNLMTDIGLAFYGFLWYWKLLGFNY